MTDRRESAFARAGWAIWKALLLLNTTGLLAVALYAARVSPDDGPGATPLLMAGVLSLCVIVLALVSMVNAALWGSATAAPWWRRLGLILLAFVGAVVIFQLAVYASDLNDRSLRGMSLFLFPLSVLVAHVLNRRAVNRYRERRPSVA